MARSTLIYRPSTQATLSSGTLLPHFVAPTPEAVAGRAELILLEQGEERRAEMVLRCQEAAVDLGRWTGLIVSKIDALDGDIKLAREVLASLEDERAKSAAEAVASQAEAMLQAAVAVHLALNPSL